MAVSEGRFYYVSSDWTHQLWVLGNKQVRQRAASSKSRLARFRKLEWPRWDQHSRERSGCSRPSQTKPELWLWWKKNTMHTVWFVHILLENELEVAFRWLLRASVEFETTLNRLDWQLRPPLETRRPGWFLGDQHCRRAKELHVR